MMGQLNQWTSTMMKEHARSMGPRIIFGWEHVAMRARIDMMSKPDVEYMSKHSGGGMLSPTLVVRDNNCWAGKGIWMGGMWFGLGKG